MVDIKGVQFVVVLTIICSVSGYPYDINVTDIKDTSAICRWKTTELTVEEFLIQCVGTQYYAVARDGRVHNTEMHVRSQFVPEGLKHVQIGDLRPNYNYTCVIEETLPEGAQVMNGLLSNPFTFTSDYTDPVQPKAPVIVKEDGTTEILLYKASNSKFGPIKGYAIQFHIFEGSFLGDIPTIEKDFTNPFGKFSPVTIEYAQTSPKSLSFQIAYIGNSLPASVLIGNDLLNGALKNGFLYRVVVVAYTERRDGSIAFSASPPSDTFMPVGVNKFMSQGQFFNDVKAEQLQIGIAAGIVIPLVCLVYMTCIGVLLLCREKRQASKYKQPAKKSFLRKTRDHMKNGMSRSWLTCLTLCFDVLRCCKCCKRKKKITKRDPKGGAKYHRVHSDTPHEQRRYPQQGYPYPRMQGYPSPRMPGYPAPRMQGYPSPMQQGYPSPGFPSPRMQGYPSPMMQQGYPSPMQQGHPSPKQQHNKYLSPKQKGMQQGFQSPRQQNKYLSPKQKAAMQQGFQSPMPMQQGYPSQVYPSPSYPSPMQQGYPSPMQQGYLSPMPMQQGYPSPRKKSPEQLSYPSPRQQGPGRKQGYPPPRKKKYPSPESPEQSPEQERYLSPEESPEQERYLSPEEQGYSSPEQLSPDLSPELSPELFPEVSPEHRGHPAPKKQGHPSPRRAHTEMPHKKQGHPSPRKQGHPSPKRTYTDIPHKKQEDPSPRHQRPSPRVTYSDDLPTHKEKASPRKKAHPSPRHQAHPSSRHQAHPSPRHQAHPSPRHQAHPSPRHPRHQGHPSPRRTYTDMPPKQQGHPSPRRAHTEMPHMQQEYPPPNYMYPEMPDMQQGPGIMYPEMPDMQQGPGIMYPDLPDMQQGPGIMYPDMQQGQYPDMPYMQPEYPLPYPDMQQGPMFTDMPLMQQGYNMYPDMPHMQQEYPYMPHQQEKVSPPKLTAKMLETLLPESESRSSTSRSMYSKAPIVDSRSTLVHLPTFSRKIKMPNFGAPSKHQHRTHHKMSHRHIDARSRHQPGKHHKNHKKAYQSLMGPRYSFGLGQNAGTGSQYSSYQSLPRMGRQSPYYTQDQLLSQQLSPRFEQTSDAHPLQYTTSATGVFNTAEEFHSPFDMPNDQAYDSPASLSVSSYQPSKVPNMASGYEQISLSSSQAGELPIDSLI